MKDHSTAVNRLLPARWRFFAILAAAALATSLFLAAIRTSFEKEIEQDALQRVDWGVASELLNLLNRVGPTEKSQVFKSFRGIRPEYRIYSVTVQGTVTAVADTPKPVRENINLNPLLDALNISLPNLPIFIEDPGKSTGQATFSVAEQIHDGQANYLLLVYDPIRGRGFSWAKIGLNPMRELILINLAVLLALGFAVRRAFRPLRILDQSIQSALEDNAPGSTSIAAPDFREIQDALEQTTSRLRDSVEQLTAEEQKNSEVIAKVVHDLRNPLTSLIGYVENLIQPLGADAAAPERYLSGARVALERFSSLIEPMLSVGERGELESSFEPRFVEAGKYVTDVFQLFSVQAEKAGVEFRYELETTPNDRVWSDERLVSRILANLVSNAIRYTNRGGSVLLRAFPEAGQSITYSVVDSGIGIASQHLPRLGEDFYRAHAELPEDRGGTGLGLATVKKFLALHLTRLDVESEPQKGSRFSFALEREKPAEVSEILKDATIRSRSITRELFLSSLIFTTFFFFQIGFCLSLELGSNKVGIAIVIGLSITAVLWVAAYFGLSRVQMTLCVLLAACAGYLSVLSGENPSKTAILLNWLILIPCSIGCLGLLKGLRPWQSLMFYPFLAAVLIVDYSSLGTSLLLFLWAMSILAMLQAARNPVRSPRYSTRLITAYLAILVAAEGAITYFHQLDVPKRLAEESLTLERNLPPITPQEQNQNAQAEYLGTLLSLYPSSNLFVSANDGSAWRKLSHFDPTQRIAENEIEVSQCGNFPCVKSSKFKSAKELPAKIIADSSLVLSPIGIPAVSFLERASHRSYITTILPIQFILLYLSAAPLRRMFERRVTQPLLRAARGEIVSSSSNPNTLAPDISRMESGLREIRLRLSSFELELSKQNEMRLKLLQKLSEILFRSCNSWAKQLQTNSLEFSSKSQPQVLQQLHQQLVSTARGLGALFGYAKLKAKGDVDQASSPIELNETLVGIVVDLEDWDLDSVSSVDFFETVVDSPNNAQLELVLKHFVPSVALGSATEIRWHLSREGQWLSLHSEIATKDSIHDTDDNLLRWVAGLHRESVNSIVRNTSWLKSIETLGTSTLSMRVATRADYSQIDTHNL